MFLERVFETLATAFMFTPWVKSVCLGGWGLSNRVWLGKLEKLAQYFWNVFSMWGFPEVGTLQSLLVDSPAAPPPVGCRSEDLW